MQTSLVMIMLSVFSIYLFYYQKGCFRMCNNFKFISFLNFFKSTIRCNYAILNVIFGEPDINNAYKNSLAGALRYILIDFHYHNSTIPL